MTASQRVRLGDITAKIGSGATPTGGESSYKRSGISLIRSQNVYDFEFSPGGLAFIDDVQADRLSNVTLRSGDVLLNITGDSIGRCCLVPDEYLPGRVNQHVCIIRADDTVADGRFLLYYLNTPRNKTELLNQVHGGTRRALTKGILEGFQIDLPPLPIQRRIAEILGRLDDKIEVNRRINRTLEVMAQALYKHWFVDFGPFQEGEFVESELGRIPKGWEVTALGKVAQVNAKVIQRGSEPDEILYVDIASVSPGKIDTVSRMSFSDAPSRARRLVTHGDTIWSAVRPNRRSFALILHPEMNVVVSTGFAVITATAVPFTYLYSVLSSQDFTEYLDGRATGAAYPAVRPEDFEQALLLLPLSDALQEYDSITQPWFEQIYALRREIKLLNATRDYLLPRLLSGEVGVEAAAVHE